HNKYGQLGLGDTADRDQFIEVSSLKGKQIVAIAAGYAYSLALDEDGKVYAAGHNDYSQLGLGDRTNRDQFVEVSSLERKKIAAISAGDAYSLALAKDGKLYAAGNNSTGFLGLDYKTNPDKFAAVPLFSYKNIIAVAAGDSYSLAIVKDGKLYATTYNGAGHLKISESEDDVSERDRFVAVSSLERKTIIAVAAAYNHSLAVAGDGKIYAIGFNDYGQLGLGDTADRDEFAAVEFNPATAR
ncbi:MAG: hypothetical protein LBC09_07890, partial [Helicobacteraceae bacterium]|nr:hypothetical protein [Helicobacteraceae bacterium]